MPDQLGVHKNGLIYTFLSNLDQLRYLTKDNTEIELAGKLQVFKKNLRSEKLKLIKDLAISVSNPH